MAGKPLEGDWGVGTEVWFDGEAEGASVGVAVSVGEIAVGEGDVFNVWVGASVGVGTADGVDDADGVGVEVTVGVGVVWGGGVEVGVGVLVVGGDEGVGVGEDEDV